MDEKPTCPMCGSEYSSWSAALACEIEDLDARGNRD